MNTILPWNALYTKPYCEEKAVSQLKKRRIAHFYPVNKIISEQSDRKLSFVLRPLFPSMIFVQVQDDQQLELLTKLNAIRNIVYWQDKPAVFSGLEIELLQDFIMTHGTVKATKFELNKKTQIDTEGQIARRMQPNDNIHSITLPSIGYSLSAESEAITSIRLQKRIADWQKIADSFAFILGYRNSGQH